MHQNKHGLFSPLVLFKITIVLYCISLFIYNVHTGSICGLLGMYNCYPIIAACGVAQRK